MLEKEGEMARVMAKQTERLGISPKVTVAALGAALSAMAWILLAAFVPTIKDNMDQGAITAVTGATATVLSFLLGYLVRDPQRH
jgi:hypothetical protein